MTLDEALAELGIDHDAGSDGARRAYLRLLKTRKPETDPEGFMRLRTAYELVKSDLPFLEAFRAREPAERKVEPVKIEVEPIEIAKVEVEIAKVEVEPLEVAKVEVEPLEAEVARVEIAKVEVPVADPVSVPPSEDADAPVHGGDIALMEALLARSAYQKAATQALLILAGATNRLDQPDPPVLSCLRLMLGLHRVAEPTRAREVSAAFTTWLAATGQESTRIRGHAAVLWTLVRELDGMKKGLPDGVRTAIAQAALAGDLAEAKPDLVRFRSKQPVAAEAAGGLLRRKAPVIAAALADALDPPRPVGVPFARAARPERDEGSKKGFWFIPMLMIGLVRIILAVGRTSTPSYPSYSDSLPAYHMPPAYPAMTFDAGAMLASMNELERVQLLTRGRQIVRDGTAAGRISLRANVVVAALDVDDCAAALAAAAALDAEATKLKKTMPPVLNADVVVFGAGLHRYCDKRAPDEAEADGPIEIEAVVDAGRRDGGSRGKTLK